MSQLTTATIEATKLYAGETPTLDLSKGGQFGYTPRYAEWLNNQAYVRRNARAILLSPPKMFESLTNPGAWISALKALIEVHPKMITGFDFGLTLSTATHAIGAGGQVQHEPVKTLRADSSPSFTYQSKIGRPEQRLFEAWIHMILDPNTTYSSAVYRDDLAANSATRTALNDGKFFADQYAATILVFEPNQSFSRVEKAAIVHNFFPLTTGPITMESNPVDDLQLEELQIDFAGIVDPCYGAIQLAQTILDELRTSVNGANPCTTFASYPGKPLGSGATARDSLVTNTDASVGYKYQIKDTASNQLKKPA